MQDLVGNKIPTQKEIDDLVAEIQAIETRIEKYTILLTKEERTSTTKFRKGGEAIVATVADLADNHGIALPKISTKGMKADLLLAQRLRPLADAVTALQQRVDDTVLEAQSECWWAATAFYSALARMMDADAKLQRALQPVVDFFAIGPRAKANGAPKKKDGDQQKPSGDEQKPSADPPKPTGDQPKKDA